MTGDAAALSYRVVEGAEQAVFCQYLLLGANYAGEADSRRFHTSRLLKAAFSWSYRTPEHIVPFTLLDGAQRERLERDPEMPFLVAPASCLHELLLAHVNLCYYRSGGDFLYYVSPAVEFADRLIQTYTGGDCRRLEEHRAVLVPERTVIR